MTTSRSRCSLRIFSEDLSLDELRDLMAPAEPTRWHQQGDVRVMHNGKTYPHLVHEQSMWARHQWFDDDDGMERAMCGLLDLLPIQQQEWKRVQGRVVVNMLVLVLGEQLMYSCTFRTRTMQRLVEAGCNVWLDHLRELTEEEIAESEHRPPHPD